MARHFSSKIVIARETYHRFFATIRARELTDLWAVPQGAGLGTEAQTGNFDWSGDPSLPGQTSDGSTAADLPFFSVDGLRAKRSKSESWIESWLSGKISGPAL